MGTDSGSRQADVALVTNVLTKWYYCTARVPAPADRLAAVATPG